jgi:hypothetical protein
MASIVLWGFTISALIAPEDVLKEASMWQSWVTQNFTWLYIGTQVRAPPPFVPPPFSLTGMLLMVMYVYYPYTPNIKAGPVKLSPNTGPSRETPKHTAGAASPVTFLAASREPKPRRRSALRLRTLFGLFMAGPA